MQLKLELRGKELKPVVLESEKRPKRNSYVETLQNCLVASGDLDRKNDKGGDNVDGKFGVDGATERAVKKFQKRKGLKDTGRVDPETAELLDKEVADKIKNFKQGDEIKDYVGPEEEKEKKGKDKEKEKKRLRKSTTRRPRRR